MIKSSLSYFAALFILYNIFLITYPQTERGIQSQWQRNVICAQEFVSSNRDYSSVILGSSLSRRLIDSQLPADCYNLSFDGQSIYEGLAVLKRRRSLPKILFIECNVVDRKPNKKFTEDLFFPGITFARKLFPCLQQQNQPVNLIFPKVSRWLSTVFLTARYKYITESKRWLGWDLTPDKRQPQSLALQDLQSIKTSASQDPPIPQELLSTLKEHLLELRSMGVLVVFFEVPQPANSSTQAKQAQLLTEFNPDEFPRMVTPPFTDYTYSDGIHLDKPSAESFTSYFAEQVQQLTPSAGRLKTKY